MDGGGAELEGVSTGSWLPTPGGLRKLEGIGQKHDLDPRLGRVAALSKSLEKRPSQALPSGSLRTSWGIKGHGKVN